MGDKTGIAWTDATWNPVVGCSIVSPGCTNCYAMKTAHSLEGRFGKGKYGGLTRVVNGNPVWTGEVRLIESTLDQPLHWKKPRRIFVNSMSDLFHEGLSDDQIDSVFLVMARCRQHQFQVLTKRAQRMRDYVHEFHLRPAFAALGEGAEWPLRNVWLGVSVENQTRANERVPLLLNTPASTRFLSCEPLLGALDLWRYLDPERMFRRHISWLIVGGESGPHFRPMSILWVQSIADQCRAARVPCFVKQDSHRYAGQKGRLPDDLWALKEFPVA